MRRFRRRQRRIDAGHLVSIQAFRIGNAVAEDDRMRRNSGTAPILTWVQRAQRLAGQGAKAIGEGRSNDPPGYFVESSLWMGVRIIDGFFRTLEQPFTIL